MASVYLVRQGCITIGELVKKTPKGYKVTTAGCGNNPVPMQTYWSKEKTNHNYDQLVNCGHHSRREYAVENADEAARLAQAQNNEKLQLLQRLTTQAEQRKAQVLDFCDILKIRR